MDIFPFQQLPLFIVVDGQDGSGKDTQAINIARYFFKKGSFLINIRSHPALDNVYGRKTKQALEQGGRRGHLIAAIFYTIDVIRSVVKYYRHEPRILIFSRYLLGVCYLPNSLIFAGYNLFERVLPTSGLFFYLEVTPEVAKGRISGRGGRKEMFEELPRLRKMHKKMRRITKVKNWIIIDGDLAPDAVWIQIKNVLDENFG